MIDDSGFRKNVGIVLTHSDGQVLLAKRVNQPAWQFPQGGIDEGETIKDTLFRELKEELGLNQQDVEILAETKGWLSYEIPKKYRRRSSACLGQTQKWFLLRLTADESNIVLDGCDEPEFDDWCWVKYWEPIGHIIEFKRKVYREVLEEFSSMIKGH